jgi:omega-6 fatty acid desaturase / acyl-lipid omega-6 desaturase (Delta-12 desaturase)
MTVEMVLMFVVGWYVYLTLHVTGRDYGKHTDHYNPKSPLFSTRDYWSIIISDIAIATVLGALGIWVYMTSFSYVFFVYGVPLGIVNFWLLLYTLLHHTDPEIPHYSPEAWDWLLGALTTVDRDYGFWDFVHHDIGSTHVLHHLFSKIPHYHAREASEAIKPVLGEYYNHASEGILASLWKVTKYCQYVDDVNAVDGVLWFPTPSNK